MLSLAATYLFLIVEDNQLKYLHVIFCMHYFRSQRLQHSAAELQVPNSEAALVY